RIAGAAVLPGAQRLVVMAPRKCVEGRLQVAVGQVVPVKQEMPAELAPAKLAEEFVDIARQRRLLGGRKPGGVPDLPRADLTEPQVRREAGCAVLVRPVTCARVALDGAGEEGPQPLLGRDFAGAPTLAQARRPIRMARLELPVFKRIAGNAGRSMQSLRCW